MYVAVVAGMGYVLSPGCVTWLSVTWLSGCPTGPVRPGHGTEEPPDRSTRHGGEAVLTEYVSSGPASQGKASQLEDKVNSHSVLGTLCFPKVLVPADHEFQGVNLDCKIF
jgi:hypothetical protein